MHVTFFMQSERFPSLNTLVLNNHTFVTVAIIKSPSQPILVVLLRLTQNKGANIKIQIKGANSLRVLEDKNHSYTKKGSMTKK